jgi:hypothetical protein
MTSPMSLAEKREAFERSAVILAHARAGNWIEAGNEVGELAERFNGPGIQILLVGLADTMVHAQGGDELPSGVTPDMVIHRPLWIDEYGDTIDNATEVARPDIRWAGQFIAARAALDEDACAALVNSCADDPETYCNNVLAVLEVTATTLNRIASS